MSSAQADPFSTTLNYGYANIGPGITGTQLLDGTQNATVTGDINTGTGAITNGDLTMPNKVFDGNALGLGAGSTITLNFNEAAPITGQAGPGPGQLVLNSQTYNATATIAGATPPTFNGTCLVTVPIAFSTETTTPYHGRRFNNPDVTGPGSVAGSGTMTNTGGPSAFTCAALTGGGIATGQTAAIWMGHNSIPTDGVPFTLTLDHSSLNVGAATGLSIIDPSKPAFYIGTIAGDAPALATDPTPSTATTAVPGGSVTYSSTDPGFHFSPSTGAFAGNTLTVNLTLEDPNGATGTFDAANGHMILGETPNDLYSASVTVDSAPGTPQCTSNDNPIDFDTDKSGGSNPLAGVRFAGLGGNGAMTDDWASLNAATLTGGTGDCNLLNAIAFQLPGGLWVSHGIAPPTPGEGGGGAAAPPAATPTGNPAALKKCIKKAKKKFKNNAKKKKKAIKKCKKKFG